MWLIVLIAIIYLIINKKGHLILTNLARHLINEWFSNRNRPFHGNCYEGENYPITIMIMQLINPNYSWKNAITQIKSSPERLQQRVFFYTVAKDLEPIKGVKCSINIFLDFCYHLLYTFEDFLCVTCLAFLKPLNRWWSVETFYAQVLHKETTLTNIICVL